MGRAQAGTSLTVGFAAAGIRPRGGALAAATHPDAELWDKAKLDDQDYLRLMGHIPTVPGLISVLLAPALSYASSKICRYYQAGVSIDRDRLLFVSAGTSSIRNEPGTHTQKYYVGPCLTTAIQAADSAILGKSAYTLRYYEFGQRKTITRADFDGAFRKFRP